MPGFLSRRIDHPFLVESLLELPDRLRLIAEQKLSADEQIETIIVIPPQTLPREIAGRGGMERVTAQVLLFTNRGILCIQGDGSAKLPTQVTYFRAEQVLYTRIILILLYGQVEIFGVENEVEKRITVKYNAARHDLLQPPLQRFLRYAWEDGSRAHKQDQANVILQQLEQQSYKFGNGLKIYALQPKETLVDFTFQPRIQRRIFGFFTSLLAPAALLAFSDRNLIIIEEGRTSATQYGWFISICPRDYLANCTFEPGSVGENLCIHLKKGTISAEFRVMLGRELAQQFQSIWSKLIP